MASGSEPSHARTRGIGLLWTSVREAGANLYAAKQRSLLGLVGIVIGVGSVIALLSVGSIVQSEAIKRFKALGTDILMIQRVSANGATKKRFDVREASRLATLPALGSVTSQATIEGYVSHAGKSLALVPTAHRRRSIDAFFDLRLAEGRFVSPLDGVRGTA